MALREIKMEALSLKDFQDKTISGFFLGSKEIDTELGTSEVHDFYNSEKQRYFSVWGVTLMNKKLKQVPVGCYVEFTYRGKVVAKTKFGQQSVHQVDVAYDPDKTTLSEKLNVVLNHEDDEDHDHDQKEAPAPKTVQAPSAKSQIKEDDLPF